MFAEEQKQCFLPSDLYASGNWGSAGVPPCSCLNSGLSAPRSFLELSSNQLPKGDIDRPWKDKTMKPLPSRGWEGAAGGWGAIDILAAAASGALGSPGPDKDPRSLPPPHPGLLPAGRWAAFPDPVQSWPRTCWGLQKVRAYRAELGP